MNDLRIIQAQNEEWLERVRKGELDTKDYGKILEMQKRNNDEIKKKII